MESYEYVLGVLREIYKPHFCDLWTLNNEQYLQYCLMPLLDLHQHRKARVSMYGNFGRRRKELTLSFLSSGRSRQLSRVRYFEPSDHFTLHRIHTNLKKRCTLFCAFPIVDLLRTDRNSMPMQRPLQPGLERLCTGLRWPMQ